jgi:hypothetical protein
VWVIHSRAAKKGRLQEHIGMIRALEAIIDDGADSMVYLSLQSG